MDRELLIISNFIKWREKKDFSPHRVELQISNTCNLQCRYCDGSNDSSPSPSKNKMELEQLVQIVQDCLDLGVKEFQFTGSESATRKKELLELIDIIKNIRVKFSSQRMEVFLTRKILKN